ncbi:MAG: pilus (MSHA type) biogenesis protein MshL [Gallionella sp.]|nr:pilus (MSHA type) biogenesis protein MshL [Gallionella sp.]
MSNSRRTALMRLILMTLAAVIAGGCASAPPASPAAHLQANGHEDAKTIPPPLTYNPFPPPPIPEIPEETFNITVHNLPVREVLFALAQDAGINLDIHADVQGRITLSALNQTLPQIVRRIANQLDLRYAMTRDTLTLMPDTPYLQHYDIDYVNIARDAESAMSTSAQVSGNTEVNNVAGNRNNSSISIKNLSRNRFWETLTQNIKDILHETDKILPAGSSETIVEQSNDRRTGAPGSAPDLKASPPALIHEGGSTLTRRSTFREAAAVIANPETGLITVRATARQHEKIREFLDQIMASARRQVMIEATIVEVRLSNNYRQGINWSALIRAEGKSFRVAQGGAGLPTAANIPGLLGIFTNPGADTITAQVNLLETFGNVRVLSSPKLSVLNNQTAVLKVVDNLVYFTIKADTTSNQSSTVTTYTTTPNTIPIGFTMSVTPQISASDSVLFNLKPAISRVVSFVNDPNPDLAKANVVSRIPQIQTREMESILKVDNNQIAVMGGLMQDEINNLTDAVPGVSAIPVAGNLFQHRNDNSNKTELVIFLRPTVIKEASLNGDFHHLGKLLPDEQFFSTRR